VWEPSARTFSSDPWDIDLKDSVDDALGGKHRSGLRFHRRVLKTTPRSFHLLPASRERRMLHAGAGHRHHRARRSPWRCCRRWGCDARSCPILQAFRDPKKAWWRWGDWTPIREAAVGSGDGTEQPCGHTPGPSSQNRPAAATPESSPRGLLSRFSQRRGSEESRGNTPATG
jgi:hypothetical protein